MLYSCQCLRATSSFRFLVTIPLFEYINLVFVRCKILFEVIINNGNYSMDVLRRWSIVINSGVSWIKSIGHILDLNQWTHHVFGVTTVVYVPRCCSVTPKTIKVSLLPQQCKPFYLCTLDCFFYRRQFFPTSISATLLLMT